MTSDLARVKYNYLVIIFTIVEHNYIINSFNNNNNKTILMHMWIIEKQH